MKRLFIIAVVAAFVGRAQAMMQGNSMNDTVAVGSKQYGADWDKGKKEFSSQFAGDKTKSPDSWGNCYAFGYAEAMQKMRAGKSLSSIPAYESGCRAAGYNKAIEKSNK